MNVTVRERDVKPAAKLSIVDCDIHPTIRNPEDVRQFLPEQWRALHREYGNFSREPLDNGMYPRITPALSRADSWPSNGGPPGSDLELMRTQHLDANGVEVGILIPLATKAGDQRNVAFGREMTRAINEWQIALWLDPEPRLRGSILVAPEDPEGAAKEIRERAKDRRFAQILLQPRALEPMGRKRYWPIFEAAVECGLPIGSHIGGQGGHAVTGSGWPSYYIEDHHAHVHGQQAFVTTLVLSGVFEQFPSLKLILTEPGFAWVPALCWRLDKHWQRFRDEVPHLTRPPSEYVRDNIYFTTQPVDEPERPADLLTIIDWIGHDKLMFATDYPHWDFDDPRYVFGAANVPKDIQAKILRENAKRVYGFA